jgi:octaprenyl-diphosphate synthase
MTLVAIHALNDGQSIDVRALARLIAKRRKREDEVRRALALLRRSGAITKARAKAFEYGQLATKSLDPIPDSDAKQSMIRLVDFVLSRDV